MSRDRRGRAEAFPAIRFHPRQLLVRGLEAAAGWIQCGDQDRRPGDSSWRWRREIACWLITFRSGPCGSRRH